MLINISAAIECHVLQQMSRVTFSHPVTIPGTNPEQLLAALRICITRNLPAQFMHLPAQLCIYRVLVTICITDVPLW